MTLINKIITSTALIALSAQTFAQNATTAQQVPGTTPNAPQGAPGWVNFALIAGIILFMWLFVFRPQSKRAKEHKNFLASLAVGTEVITSGGIIGIIEDVKENVVSLKIGSNSTIRVLKSSISGKMDGNSANSTASLSSQASH